MAAGFLQMVPRSQYEKFLAGRESITVRESEWTFRGGRVGSLIAIKPFGDPRAEVLLYTVAEIGPKTKTVDGHFIFLTLRRRSGISTAGARA